MSHHPFSTQGASNGALPFFFKQLAFLGNGCIIKKEIESLESQIGLSVIPEKVK